MNDPIPVPVTSPMIRLGQFLKLANVVESGAHVKILLADEQVTVNDVVETRRGAKLHPGDVVAVDELRFVVTYNDE